MERIGCETLVRRHETAETIVERHSIHAERPYVVILRDRDTGEMVVRTDYPNELDANEYFSALIHGPARDERCRILFGMEDDPYCQDCGAAADPVAIEVDSGWTVESDWRDGIEEAIILCPDCGAKTRAFLEHHGKYHAKFAGADEATADRFGVWFANQNLRQYYARATTKPVFFEWDRFTGESEG